MGSVTQSFLIVRWLEPKSHAHQACINDGKINGEKIISFHIEYKVVGMFQRTLVRRMWPMTKTTGGEGCNIRCPTTHKLVSTCNGFLIDLNVDNVNVSNWHYQKLPVMIPHLSVPCSGIKVASQSIGNLGLLFA